MTKNNTLFSDFLKVLGVRHTTAYSNEQFTTMPFQSLFGLMKLLEKYKVDGKAYNIADRSEMALIPTPFLADTPQGFLIVTAIAHDTVHYISEGVNESIPLSDFCNVCNGTIFIAEPQAGAIEPDYGLHRRYELIDSAKKWLLGAGVLALFIYLFISNGIYSHISTICLTIVNILGLILTFMLVQKSLKIKNKAADKVCGVLEEGGCDSILQLKASTFFGIFSWSELGFAYFSVSLLTLLIFPEWIKYLATINLLCLPFTVWSIWYQKFRAKVWCTLCVSVQTCLWLLFFSYFFGGWFKGIFPLRIEFFVLGITYMSVLLLLNRILPHFRNNQ